MQHEQIALQWHGTHTHTHTENVVLKFDPEILSKREEPFCV